MEGPEWGARRRDVVRLGGDEARFLAGHLGRLVAWDDRTPVRLVTRRRVVAVLAVTPMGALSFVAVPIAPGDDEPDGDAAAGPPERGVDAVVSAARLRDCIGDVTGLGAGDVREIAVPDDVGAVVDLAVLPPDGPWIPAERATAGDVDPLVATAIKRFRTRAEGLSEAAAQDLAERTWDARTWGGLPLRALHAARALGFLARDAARVESATCAGWKRLMTPAGQVFVRPVGASARLRLSVLS